MYLRLLREFERGMLMISRDVSEDWRNLYDEVNELDRPRKSMTSFH